MAREWQALNAVVELRRTAADCVVLADTIIYAESEAAKADALRMLPRRVRALMFRATRCLTALEERP
jgi:hypothetical protein